MSIRYAFAVCLGITVANGVYILVAVTGLEVVKGMVTVMAILKYLGGAYLIYIGIMLLRAPERSFESSTKNLLHVKRIRKQFTMGFMSAIFNPKVAIVFLALLPQFVEVGAGPVAAQFFFHGTLIMLWQLLLNPTDSYKW